VESHEFKSFSQNAKRNGNIDGDKNGIIIQSGPEAFGAVFNYLCPPD
jgi:hypothetical protein